ncbi:MAG: helix-turn-helix domain-containing protein, partial [Sandaracinaceae bacterium]|nr:helix-turn-helix domain-containing protein [Sandaracinaceae bacterium]
DELAAVVEAAVARALDARERADPQPPAEWLTVEEAADFLGYRASYLRKRLDIPVYKVGRRRRYKRSELEALLLASR